MTASRQPSRAAARPTRGGSTRAHATESPRPGDVLPCPSCGSLVVVDGRGYLLEPRPIVRHYCREEAK